MNNGQNDKEWSISYISHVKTNSYFPVTIVDGPINAYQLYHLVSDNTLHCVICTSYHQASSKWTQNYLQVTYCYKYVVQFVLTLLLFLFLPPLPHNSQLLSLLNASIGEISVNFCLTVWCIVVLKFFIICVKDCWKFASCWNIEKLLQTRAQGKKLNNVGSRSDDGMLCKKSYRGRQKILTKYWQMPESFWLINHQSIAATSSSILGCHIFLTANRNWEVYVLERVSPEC